MCEILLLYNNKYNISLNDFLLLLEKIQHRGQDNFGFSYLEQNSKNITKTIKGLIKNNIDPSYKTIISNLYLGHTRYITSGVKTIDISQPIEGCFNNQKFIVCFNGNIELTNYVVNKQTGEYCQTDTKLIVKFIENEMNKNKDNDNNNAEIKIFENTRNLLIILIEHILLLFILIKIYIV